MYENGNLISDSNVKKVIYNHLDLPIHILSEVGEIQITYAADGRKLKQKETNADGETTETIYIDGMEYVNGKRSNYYFAEGRIMYDTELMTSDGPLKKDFVEWSISDHLGNTRIRYIDKNNDNQISVNDEDQNINELSGSYHYYPFGLKMEGNFTNHQGVIEKYQYNGIEQSSVVASGIGLTTYRVHDAAIGRWWQVDPKAESLSHMTPYNAMANNPILYNDPNGDFIFAAVMGAMISMGSATFSGNAKSVGSVLGYGAVGALSGGIGASVGGAVAGSVGSLGFTSGALSGGAGGAAAGFVGSAGNAWLGGASFGQGLGAGLKGAGIGGLTGGLVGGISGGISALSKGGNFWTGSHTNEVGGAIVKPGDHFLNEKIQAGHRPTTTGKVATTKSNPLYGKYGWTRNSGHKMHKGVDYVGNVGDDVYAMYDGTVNYIGKSKTYGSNFVRIESTLTNSNGITYNYYQDYGHLSAQYLNVGHKVTAGQLIGLMGREGNLAGTSFPTHVHVSVFRWVGNKRGFVEPWF